MSSIDQSAITDGINGLIASGKGLLGNPIASAIGGAIVGSAVTGAIVGSIGSTKTKSSSSRKRYGGHTRRGWKQDRKRFNKSQKWEVAYRKRKAKTRGGKRVKYTKNGQPYIILKSGKARFVKKK